MLVFLIDFCSLRRPAKLIQKSAASISDVQNGDNSGLSIDGMGSDALAAAAADLGGRNKSLPNLSKQNGNAPNSARGV